MEHVIRLLPDAIANQIAAGEVVQRPASVVKELLENAIDAKATRIELHIKDAGKTLIQVTDNGSGMTAADARMCFERHATSKIKEKEDLFNILTFGFRGEALASIAAVAQVRLRTRQQEAELGTEIEIEGSQFKKQESCVTPVGTVFQVKNLFFNVPARRNFLKSNPVETRHIIQEFLRVAIPNPQIALSLFHNEIPVFELQPSSLQERLAQLFGNNFRNDLYPVDEETGYVRITGMVGSPALARKSRDESFFFVNGRFIKSPFLHHAILSAYEQSIPKEQFPFYCIFLEIDPVHVDINIHPTKTEVKFDDEQTLYVLLNGAVKRHLAQADTHTLFDQTTPEIRNAIYNSRPIQNEKPAVEPKIKPNDYFGKSEPRPNVNDWDKLYKPATGSSGISSPKLWEVPPTQEPATQGTLFEVEASTWMSSWNKDYVLSERQGNLYIIDRKAARERILYERFLRVTHEHPLPSQQLLFPQTFEFATDDKYALLEAEEELLRFGLEVRDFAQNSLIVYGMPAELPQGQLAELLDMLIADIKTIGRVQIREQMSQRIARNLAIRAAGKGTFSAQDADLKELVYALFQSESFLFAPSGAPICKIIKRSELDAFFGR